MPQTLLTVKAELENIRAMVPVEGNFWKFDIQCSNGGVDQRKGITVSTTEVYDLDGSRGDANFVIKWPGSREQSYIKVVPHKKVATTITQETAGTFVPLLALECRGIEITKWHPSCDFTVITVGGTRYPHEKVDLTDRDWAEYDEENDQSVSIANLEYKFENA